MNERCFTFLIYVTIIVSQILSVSSQAQNISEEAEKKLQELDQVMTKAVLEGDYETILNYHTDDAIVMADFKPAIKGKQALREQYEKDKKKGVKIHSFTGNAEKRWNCGNDILERGTFGLAVSSNDSPRPTAFYGSYFQILQEQPDGTYKIKLTIWNLDFNPFESQN